jgi:uncharacterized protein YlxW (UPF0749 family)
MTGLLGLAIPPWLSPTLIGAIGIAVVAGGSGAYIDHKFMAGAVATAKLETAQTEATYKAYAASTVANAAKATSDAEAERKRLQSHSDDLQRQLIETEKANDDKSAKLRQILASAKPGDIRALGPNVLEYLSGVRNN